MSRRKPGTIVSRNYRAEPGAMADAISLLLRMPCKERAAELAPVPNGRNDAAIVRNTEEGVSDVEQRTR